MANTVDISALAGKTGLISEHEVSSDSERTRMRSIKEIKELDEYLTAKNTACDSTARTNVMRGLFGFRAVARQFNS